MRKPSHEAVLAVLLDRSVAESRRTWLLRAMLFAAVAVTVMAVGTGAPWWWYLFVFASSFLVMVAGSILSERAMVKDRAALDIDPRRVEDAKTYLAAFEASQADKKRRR